MWVPVAVRQVDCELLYPYTLRHCLIFQTTKSVWTFPESARHYTRAAAAAAVAAAAVGKCTSVRAAAAAMWIERRHSSYTLTTMHSRAVARIRLVSRHPVVVTTPIRSIDSATDPRAAPRVTSIIHRTSDEARAPARPAANNARSPPPPPPRQWRFYAGAGRGGGAKAPPNLAVLLTRRG